MDRNKQNMTMHIRADTKKYAISIPLLRKIVGWVHHPWFNGLTMPKTLSGSQPATSLDLSAPILFLARGHSGTTPLTKILAGAGVYMGNPQDRNALNKTLDALYWIFGLQRTMVPRLFKPGVGCLVDERITTAVTLECLKRHLGAYGHGRWGFKTCAGMFCHSLYQYAFPRAKYIYLVRDGRDVILSGNGYFHLSHPYSRYQHWEYFKIITFGICNDTHSCPFQFPDRPGKDDAVMRNRFWIQAKSWREHVRMVEHLRKTGQLSPNVCTIRYEELCRNPIPILEQLFHFLEVELTAEVKELATRILHTRSIGRWQWYDQHISDYDEDIAAVFASMEPELELLGYLE